MKTYIGLLRGINMLGRNCIRMNELASIFEEQGYSSVRTYIQSGNVIFNSDKIPDISDTNALSRAVHEKKGFSPAVMIIDAERLRKAAENNPFPSDTARALHIFFLDSAPSEPDLEKLKNLKKGREEYRLLGDIFYLYTPDGFGRSKLAASAEKALGVPATGRNWNTVTKLLSMLSGS